MNIEEVFSNQPGQTNWPNLGTPAPRKPKEFWCVDLDNRTIFRGTKQQADTLAQSLCNNGHQAKARLVRLTENSMQEDERRIRHDRQLGITFRR